MKRSLLLTASFVLLFAADALAATPIPVSENPLEYYAQGGIVVNGIAYFTAQPDWGADSEFVTSFDAETLAKVRRYDFSNTYDSTPYIFQKIP